jgi:two-component system chemotaxis response regulator CheY
MTEKLFLQNLSLALASESAFQRRIVPGILRSAGAARVHTPRTERELTNLFAADVIDVAIIDDEIDGDAGMSVVRNIRQSPSSDVSLMPIIYLMTGATRMSVMEAAQAGVHEVVTKPYSARTLLDRLYWPVRFPRQFIRSETYFGPVPRTVLQHAQEKQDVVQSERAVFELDDTGEAQTDNPESGDTLPLAM